jgi:phosphoribosylaminoimidazolecarboxamide formyltransferase/IMP cyclohydrolase
VEAVRQAIQKAQKLVFDLSGSVLASDGFFPFPDSVALAAAAGIKVFIQPGGSIRDKQVIEWAAANDVVMLLAGIRHFRH